MKPITLITGANRGIGFELTRALISRGSQVLAAVRMSSPQLEALAGEHLEVITGVDVTTDDAPNQVLAALGERSLSLVIANAGILQGNSLSTLDRESLRAQFEVNAVAPLRLVAALVPRLKSGSKVALITSRMGSMADNTSGGNYGYRMSKAALNAAGRSLAMDLRPQGVAVGLLHPGWVQTDMTSHSGQLTAKASAALLLQRIDELSLQTSGNFVHANGEALPF